MTVVTEVVEETPEETVTVETTEVTLAPKPTEEVPERETVEVTFAPKPTEEALKPEVTEVTLAPKPTEEVPSEVAEVEFKPKPKDTAIWEAPEDFEIVIERFEEVKEVPVEEVPEEAPEVVTAAVEIKKAPKPADKVELQITPEEPEEVTTTIEVRKTKVTKEGMMVTCMADDISIPLLNLCCTRCTIHHAQTPVSFQLSQPLGISSTTSVTCFTPQNYTSKSETKLDAYRMHR